MDDDLRERYFQAIFRFKKHSLPFHQGSDVSITEMIVMRNIAHSDGPCIHDNLHITKAAVSQTLNSLEKKGFIIREIDKTNRRKITVTLTQAGHDALMRKKERADRMLEEIVSRFGEENIWQLIKLIERMSDISETVKRENESEIKEGDEQFD